ncbi:MAG: helix-turn-helix domain-containing protein [Myxococcota bacterium]|nr:helix-turn-helix domain-containing protein [Myxococcota bacterium]
MPSLPPPRGILRAPRPDGFLDARRLVPSLELAPHIHHYWSIRWSLRSPFKGESLPHPAAQILRIASSAERRACVLGVPSGAIARTLTDKGETFGVSFRPVMFQALLGASMASITDRVVPLEHVLGESARPWGRAIDAARAPEEKVSLTEALLSPLLATPSRHLERLRDLVERIAFDRSILRVDDIARASDLDTRALQRCFRTYVGVSPKSVIHRYRLHEAAIQLGSPHPPSLAELAASLGYADQAHFGRDFKRTVGQTPRAFGLSHGSPAGRSPRTSPATMR